MSSEPTTIERLARSLGPPAIVLATSILFAWSNNADACSPYFLSRASITSPVLLDPQIRETAAVVSLDCAATEKGWSEGTLRCALRVSQTLRSEATEPVVTSGVVALVRAEGIEIRHDGIVVDRAATLAERDRWREVEATQYTYVHEYTAPTLRSFDVALEPGEEVDLEIIAEVTISLETMRCWRPALHRRHPQRMPYPAYGPFVYWNVDDAPSPLDIEVTLPRGWALDDRYGDLAAKDTTRQRIGHRRRRYRARLAPAGDALKITASHDLRFARGGPIVGAGIDLGAGPRPRLRAGWELALVRPWWVQSLVVESDLRALTIVPATELSLLIFYITSVGVGVPLRVYPDARAGVRAQLSIGWRRAAVLGTFDAFPERKGRTELRGGVMVQVGLW